MTAIIDNTELHPWQWTYYNENLVREIDEYGLPLIFMKTLIPRDLTNYIYDIFDNSEIPNDRFMVYESAETKIFIPLEDYTKYYTSIKSIFARAISPEKVQSQLRIFEGCNFNPKKFPSATDLHMSKAEWGAFIEHARKESKGTSLLKEEKARVKKEQERLSKFDDDNWTPFWPDFEHEIRLENIWPDLMKEIQQRKISH